MSTKLVCYIRKDIIYQRPHCELYIFHYYIPNYLWHSCNNTPLKLQNKAIRIIIKMPYIAHTYLLYKTNKILKMQDLYELQSIIFMTNYERNTLPASFNNMYTHNFDNHPHIHTSNIYLNRQKKQFGENLPTFALPKIWNRWIKQINLSNCTGKMNIQVKIL